jgi:N-carbamoyl-L-amino-acid hydrolase
MAGTLTREKLATLRDREGLTLEEARAAAGCQGAVADAQLAKGAYHAFVELHIEQGARLEKAGIPIGIVTAIAAPATIRVQFTGEGGHAGTVLMPERHDPALAAAETMLASERAARSTGDENSVATCGVIHVQPGAVNSIPREVRIEIDVRDIDRARRDAMVAEIRAFAQAAARRRGCGWSDELLNADPPAICESGVVQTIAGVCEELALPNQQMISRAYHDSLFMALICPTSMIFVPSKGGFSHRPDEFTSIEEITQGVEVLARGLARLAG